MDRMLYLVTYAITNDRRLYRVRYFLKGYSTGGQKSVYECFLTDGELRYVKKKLERLMKHLGPRLEISVFRISRLLTFPPLEDG